jgi:hypothetical protein
LEKIQVSQSLSTDWKERLTCLNVYGLQIFDIGNFDETGLFVRAQQRYTLAVPSDYVAGRKEDKCR